MERELYRALYCLTYDLARTHRTKHVVYRDHRIVMIWFWAVLHERPIRWACDRRHWPDAARLQRLPHASTISRRRRTAGVQLLIDGIEQQLLQPGYAGGHRIAKGYKLHVIYSVQRVPVCWSIRPMNEKEAAVAPQLIEHLPHSPGILVGDHAYDSNRLCEQAGQRGWQLLAPRLAARGFGHRRHSRWRLIAHQEWSEHQRRQLLHQRAAIERYFAHLGNVSFGLSPLPNWVRTLERVTAWVRAKIILHLLWLYLQRRPQMQ